jgi:hypothetical protein
MLFAKLHGEGPQQKIIKCKLQETGSKNENWIKLPQDRVIRWTFTGKVINL